jgi:fucose permease
VYALLLAIIYLAFVSLGLPDSLVGAGWPAMHQDLDVHTSYAGLVTMIITGGTIVSSLLSERLTRKLGTGLVTAISVGMTAAALVGFSGSSSFWMLLLWAVPYGLGAGAVDAGLNNYVALHYSSRHMSWLHGCWGVGASLSPFVMGYALSHGHGWGDGFLVVGALQVLVTVLLFVGVPLWTRVHPRVAPTLGENPVQHGEPSPTRLTTMGALRLPGVKYMVLAFFGYCSIETTIILWSSSYLVDQRGFSTAAAATFASMYLIGMTVGRFLSGFVADRWGDRRMIQLGMALVILGIVVFALPIPLSGAQLAGLIVVGLGSAPVYPAIIHSTPDNFGARHSHVVIGIQMAAAYLGSSLMPPLFGLVSAGTGMWIFPFYLLVLAALVIVMSQALNRSVDRRDSLGPGRA